MEKKYKDILKHVSVLKSPKHRLATFGQTKIDYFYISKMTGFEDRCRLKTGQVVAEKPKILTPEYLRNRFEGFGQESDLFGKWLLNQYGDVLRGLEYQFKNEFASSSVEHNSSAKLCKEIIDRIDNENKSHSAILMGPDEFWQIGLMKFIVDECLASFPSNVTELDEHGFFETSEDIEKNRHQIIQRLIRKAREDRSQLPRLGEKLKEFGLFHEYEDVFFGLMQK